jgi:outer membrane scaffolding protein for murein synthesis (MipA/OmpV family)
MQTPGKNFFLLPLAVAILCSMAGASHAADSTENADAAAPVSGFVGVVALNVPRYPGSATQRTLMLPVGEVNFDRRFFVSAIDGVGVNLYQDAHWRVGTSLAIDFSDRHESDSTRLKGMGDISRAARARAFVKYRTGNFQFDAAMGQDVSGGARGLVGEVTGLFVWPLSEQTSIRVGPGLTWGNGVYNQTWFGVSNAQSTQSGLPAYAVSAGLVSERLKAGINHSIDRHWFLSAEIVRTRLSGDAAASPVVERVAQTAIQLVLAKTF